MSRLNRYSPFFLPALIAALFLACSGDKNPVKPPTEPIVAAMHRTSDFELEVGQSRVVEMYAEYVGDPTWIAVPARWTSRDTALVSVDSLGHLTAHQKVGVTYVTGLALSHLDSVRVSVRNSAFYIWPDTALLRPGSSRSFRVQSFSSSNGPRTETASAWSSSDPTIASVDGAGLVTSLRPGQVTIIATDGNRRATAEVFVAAYDHALAFQESAIGYGMACGREADGLVSCWGKLAPGPTTSTVLDRCADIRATHLSPTYWNRYEFRCAGTPVLMSSTIRLASLISGNSFEHRPYGLDADGALYAVTDSGLRRVAAGSNFKSVTVAFHTCGITSNGVAECWGVNSSGELGIGSAQSLGPWPGTPQMVAAGALTWSTLVAREDGTCGLATGGEAYCWGDNRNFRLGIGPDSTTQPACYGPCVTVPKPVSTTAKFVRLAARTGDACGVSTDDVVYCWGIFPTQTSMSDSLAGTPIAVTRAPSFVSLHSGLTQLCGVTADGSVYCLSRNESAATLASIYSFVRLPLPFPAASLSINAGASCARSAANGLLYCWGDGTTGTLGDGQFGTATADQPVEVAGQR